MSAMIIEKELLELESRIDSMDVLREDASARSVGWHILHSLKVIQSILVALKKSDPERYERKFNFLRTILFAFNWFPRGRAKAPKIVQPEPEQVTRPEIETMLAEVRSQLHEVDKLPPNTYFRHPYFGKLNIEHTRKFLRLHTRHHLKIIASIVAK
jgi:hypothetical protein